MLDSATKFDMMLRAMVGNEVQDHELWTRGYKAFADCQQYSDMATQLERNGWEAAYRDCRAMGQRIAQRGR